MHEQIGLPFRDVWRVNLDESSDNQNGFAAVATR
jgi:hypothetical protein